VVDLDGKCVTWMVCKWVDVPQRTSPSISVTFFFHFFSPSGSSQSLTFSTLLAMDSTSLGVSFLSTAAKTRRPFLMDEMSSPLTVTDADLTRCITA